MGNTTITGKHYLSVIFKWWWLLVLLPLLAIAAAFVALNGQPRVYQSEAQVMVGPGVASANPDYNTLRASEHLLETYHQITSTDAFSQSVINDVGLGQMSPSDFQSMIDVRPDPNSLTLTVVASAKTSKLAADIANSVVQNLYRMSPDYPGNPAAVSRQQSQAQLDQLNSTIQDTQARISALQQEVQQLTQQDPATNRAINQSLTNAENQIDTLEAQYQAASTVADQERQGNAILQALTLNTFDRINQLQTTLNNTGQDTRNLVIEQIAAEKDHLANLQKALSDNQQAVEGMALSDYINQTQTNITNLEANLSRYYDVNTKRLLNDQINSERTRLVNAESIASTRQSNVLTQLSDERQRLSAIRMLPISQNNYLTDQITQERNRLASLENTHASLATTLSSPWTNQIQISQPATEPLQAPSNLRLFLLIAAIAGAALALALIIVFAYFDRSYETAEDLEQALGVPSFGVVPKPVALWNRKLTPEEELVVKYQPNSQAAEDYRIVAARLSSQLKLLKFDQNQARRSTVLMISGLNSDAITGQIGANLGILLAETGQQIMLVDANLNHPFIASALGIPENNGLVTALSSHNGEMEPVRLPENRGLSIMPIDPTPENLFGMFASPRFSQFLEGLKQQASLILIAAPPLTSGAEAFILASQVNGILLVLPEGNPDRKQVEEVIKNRETYSWKILGTVAMERQRSWAAVNTPAATPHHSASNGQKIIEFEHALEARGVNRRNGNQNSHS